MLTLNPVKRLQKKQGKALAVFQKAKNQQGEVLVGIANATKKIEVKIAKEQAKQKELAKMHLQATKFNAKISEFLCEEPEAPKEPKPDKVTKK